MLLLLLVAPPYENQLVCNLLLLELLHNGAAANNGCCCCWPSNQCSHELASASESHTKHVHISVRNIFFLPCKYCTYIHVYVDRAAVIVDQQAAALAATLSRINPPLNLNASERIGLQSNMNCMSCPVHPSVGHCNDRGQNF